MQNIVYEHCFYIFVIINRLHDLYTGCPKCFQVDVVFPAAFYNLFLNNAHGGGYDLRN